MNLADFRTDRNRNPYGLKKCKYHCDYGDGEYCHYKETDGCIYNKNQRRNRQTGNARTVNKMPDREKVIKELENAPNTVKDGFYYLRITHKLRDDAVSLLKEQQKLIDEITQQRANNGAFD